MTSPYGLVYNDPKRIEPYGEARTLFASNKPNGEGMVDMITDSVSFGQALRARRRELGYTQAFISEVSGLSVSFISDLENGKRTIELDKAIRLANLLGLDCSLTPRGKL